MVSLAWKPSGSRGGGPSERLSLDPCSPWWGEPNPGGALMPVVIISASRSEEVTVEYVVSLASPKGWAPDRNRPDSELLAGADHPQGDFTAIGN